MQSKLLNVKKKKDQFREHTCVCVYFFGHLCAAIDLVIVRKVHTVTVLCAYTCTSFVLLKVVCSVEWVAFISLSVCIHSCLNVLVLFVGVCVLVDLYLW